jgi:arginyl-tRNA synthetase
VSTQVEQLEAAIKAALEQAINAGSLSGQIPASIKLERPKDRGHGDYATSIALQLAKPAGKTLAMLHRLFVTYLPAQMVFPK